MVIGIALIGYGIYSLIAGQAPPDTANEELKTGSNYTQSLAMMAFGALCLISGIAFKRR